MFLTKECDYAIRVIRSLADMQQKTAKIICDQEVIPLQYSYKILKRLEKAGIVTTCRGTTGGYRLSKPADSLTLFDVVNAVSKNIFVSECLRPTSECPHQTDGNVCSVHQEFCRIQNIVIDALREKAISQVF